MNRSAAWLVTPALCVWASAALICPLLCASGAHTAQAGVNVWTTNGPEAVNVFSVAIDPVTPTTLYAGYTGSTDAGVYKSTDAGGTWHIANTGLPGAGVSALALDPGTPSTLYAGIPYLCVEPPCFGAGGLFKSVDASGTWHAADTGLLGPSVGVNAIALDPKMPSTLYAGVDGVFKSTDAGDTWSNTGLPGVYTVTAIAIDPTTSATLYVGTFDCGSGCRDGVFKSTTGGGSWSAVNTGLPDNGVLALAIDPTSPTTLYAGTFGGASPPGIFKSTDGGSTWREETNTGIPAGAGDAVWGLAIDASAPSTIYAGTGGGVFKSTTGGGSWSAVNAGLTPNAVLRALAIDPITPSMLYAGTDLGVFSIQQVAVVCVGNCGGTHAVTIDEISTLVNIALGDADPSTCPNGGLPIGGDVTVAVIIEAINNTLNGCAG